MAAKEDPTMTAVAIPVPPTRMTPEAMLDLPDQGRGYELVDGELVEVNMSTLSNFVGGEFHWQLCSHVKPRKAGWVLPDGTSYHCFLKSPGKVRRADTAFIRLERLSVQQVMTTGHCPVVPDLVVEVVSPNDLAQDVNAKRIEWLEAGASLVWIVYPVEQNIFAYSADGPIRLFQRDDILTADPVLPDFRVAVAELFQLPVS